MIVGLYQAVLAAAGLVTIAMSAGLVDDPVVGDLLTSLDSSDVRKWTAASDKLRVEAHVPGDLLTDLERANKIADPLKDTNFKNSRAWDGMTWTYSLQFNLTSQQLSYDEIFLVFDGVKMGAEVSVNAQKVAETSNQFLRYRFPVKQYLKGANLLEVSFPHEDGPDEEGRFMPCTGGWDWAPYTNTYDRHRAHTFSRGIWKSVYLVGVASAVIAHMKVHTTYLGDPYPLEILEEPHTKPFKVTVTLYLWAPAAVRGRVTVFGSWGLEADGEEQSVNIPAKTETPFTMTIQTTSVDLWWPVGVGKQNLYTVYATFVPDNGGKVLTVERRVGFRVFNLVTSKIVTASDVAKVQRENSQGSDSFTMRYRVNGADLFIRGANMIPMEELEGRSNADAYYFLVKSAADAHMNMLRVWGGGIFYHNAFYDACDELGVLIFHDMMYDPGRPHKPLNSPSQESEIRHQVRRLSHHPCIVIWAACNECSGKGLYETFVMPTIASEDKSRPLWPSSPSGGWSKGVDRLTGLPNDDPLVAKGRGSIDYHGPYLHGLGKDGFRAVDANPAFGRHVDPRTPSSISMQPTGIAVKGMFRSEFGGTAPSSYESMAATLSDSNMCLHCPAFHERNYACDNIIEAFFGTQAFPSTPDKQLFKKHLYMCMIGHAFSMRGNIEQFRSGNYFGLLTWQLNEIWPTIGWGSIEYGSPVPGQVVGGRWKPTHHFYERTLYRDIFATCGNSGRCIVKNDSPFPFKGTFVLEAVHFGSGRVVVLNERNVTLPRGAGPSISFCGANTQQCSLQQLIRKAACKSKADCVLVARVQNEKCETVVYNPIALTTPGEMKLARAEITFRVGAVLQDKSVEIHVVSDAVAMYVTFTTMAHGRFSDNAFVMLPCGRTIRFIPFGKLDVETLKSTLRVESVNEYLGSHRSDTSQPFCIDWVATPFSECSAECHGTQTRSAKCKELITDKDVPDTKCEHLVKPVLSQQCSTSDTCGTGEIRESHGFLDSIFSCYPNCTAGYVSTEILAVFGFLNCVFCCSYIFRNKIFDCFDGIASVFGTTTTRKRRKGYQQVRSEAPREERNQLIAEGSHGEDVEALKQELRALRRELLVKERDLEAYRARESDPKAM